MSIKDIKDFDNTQKAYGFNRPFSKNPQSKDIIIYTSSYCPYCIRARALLASKGWVYEDIAVDSDDRLRLEMMQKSGRATVPQIWIRGKHIGGCDELFALEMNKQLEAMVEGLSQ